MDYFKRFELLNKHQSQSRKRIINGLSGLCLVLACLVLLWFFGIKNSKTFLISSPKVYAVSSFKLNTRYLLAKEDSLRGTASPSGFVKIILKEPKIEIHAKADKKGVWQAQIPSKIPEKNYQFQLITFDKAGKNPKVKLYKVQVQSNNLIHQTSWYKKLASTWAKIKK